MDTDLPPLRGLYILGTLEFPTNSSNVLSAACIVVVGGTLNVGKSAACLGDTWSFISILDGQEKKETFWFSNLLVILLPFLTGNRDRRRDRL